VTTLRQSLKNKHIFKGRRIRSTALDACPQKRGICTKVTIMKPKKPNSAIRKIAKVRLTNKKRIIVYICGIGHNLQEHSSVLVRGGRVRDLPGIHYKAIKGKLDFHWKEMVVRKKGRSKYGMPALHKIYGEVARKKK